MNGIRWPGTCVSLCVLSGCMLFSPAAVLAQGSKMTSEVAPIADADRDNPAAREQWFRKGRTAPPGQSAAELRYRAHQQKMRMRAQRARAAAQLALTPNAPAMGWTALGPAPLASRSEERRVGKECRSRCAA